MQVKIYTGTQRPVVTQVPLKAARLAYGLTAQQCAEIRKFGALRIGDALFAAA